MAVSPKKSKAKMPKSAATDPKGKGAVAKPATRGKTPMAKPRSVAGKSNDAVPSNSTAPVAFAPAAKPAVVEAPQSVVVGPAMRKKEIIEQVVARSGLKKRDVKPILDHLLVVLGEGLADGRELVIPPMGRVKVHKKKETAKKTIHFAKIHRNISPPPAQPKS